jgi:hypothetical protein
LRRAVAELQNLTWAKNNQFSFAVMSTSPVRKHIEAGERVIAHAVSTRAPEMPSFSTVTLAPALLSKKLKDAGQF